MSRNMATFFQKHNGNKFVGLFKTVYTALVLNSNNRIISYLRDAGAVIGKNCIIRSVGEFGSEPYLVEVGDNTSFSSGVKLITHDGSTARLYYMGLTEKKFDSLGKVKIGSNCFIGMNAMILKNVTIGDNCIIGAGAVVTKSVPANSVIAGVPAKVIGTTSDFAAKNRDNFDDTLGMSPYEKRRYVEANQDKFKKRRSEKEMKA